MGDLKILYDRQEPDSKPVMISVIISILFLFITIFASYYFYLSQVSVDQDRKQDNAKRNTYIQSLEKEVYSDMENYDYIDKESKIVRVPINVAIDDVVEKYNNL